MALSISVPSGQYDANGNIINVTYWKIVSVNADVVNQTLSMQVNGYASSIAFNANPQQNPILVQTVIYPDAVNCPGVSWPFSPAALMTNYPNNSAAFLLAAQAYAELYPIFAGATMVP